jgi:hypothetical protein
MHHSVELLISVKVMHLSGRRDLVRYSLDARSPDITHA